MPPRHRMRAGGALIATAIAVVAAGCGAAAGRQVGAGSVLHKRRAGARTTSGSLVGWSVLRLPSGGALPYPSNWRRVRGDPGTASAAQFNANGTIRAYLNATPAEGHETLHGWARFRIRHNADEGDRDVRLIAAHAGVRVAAGRASCVVDDYATSRSRYRELACIIAPSNGGRATVLVAAAEPNAWSPERTKLDFALDHFAG